MDEITAQRLAELNHRCNEQQLQINRLRETIDMLTKDLKTGPLDIYDIENAAGKANNHLWGVD